jgi:ring-1,2-phenylacetyl-CoA epoxidase subunit PaaA
MRTWADLDELDAFIGGGGMVEPNDDIPDEYRQEVFRFIEFHANSELMGGLTERDWIPRAPGLRLKQVFLAKTQDEIGHAHLLYMIAADMGVKTRTEMLEDLFAGRSRFHNVFHYQAVTWADQIAIAYLVDAAAFASQRAVFAECSYGPYKRILRRIVAEEGFHMRHGEEMLMRLAEGTPIQRGMFQAALDRWWWPAVQLFGPDSDPADPLLRWKIKSQRNEDLRDAYIQKYVPLLRGYRFRIPDDGLGFDEPAGKWATSPIDWTPLKATMRQGGPDSRRRIETASRNWADTAWVREALDAAPRDAA